MHRSLAILIALTATVRAAAPDGFERVVSPFLRENCVGCHGPKKQKGKLRLDTLSGDLSAKADEIATWKTVLEQLETGDMPPKEEPRPKREETDRVVRWLRAELGAAGQLAGGDDIAFPSKGNYVDHDKLFNRPSTAAPATPARIWRMSPFGYRELMDDLAGGRLSVQGGPAVRAKRIAVVVTPFGLTSDPGFRDYAFRYRVGGSESLQMNLNAKTVLDAMLAPRKNWRPPGVLADIANATAAPTAKQVQAAVSFLFQEALYRDPTAAEMGRYSAFVVAGIKRFGNRDGLIQGLTPVLLHPDAVFRNEFGHGTPDAHGRVMLAPIEMAVAITYALTDERPSAALLAAARGGRLSTRDDVRREVTRMLDDRDFPKPRILRFFQEYFDYYKAPEVFKDASVLQAAKLARDAGAYHPEKFVEDTDALVEYVLAKDRDVLRELLTTDKTFIGIGGVEKWLQLRKQHAEKQKDKNTPLPTHPFGDKSPIHKFYSFDAAQWSVDMPLTFPPNQRAGILTQPSWLIAHSANTDNHAIDRGKWIRERLLGGHIPDTPITVDAKLPDEPSESLRHRMRVTREEYCWKCHVSMDPLGLPFEIYDHFGQFRTTELGKPLDASGEIVASGDAKLDGKVSNALEMIRKLAGSERVHQVFVRHAFRYWMGRNETLNDAPTLQAAYKAYQQSSGSMKALITSLLTSDSFIYRITPDAKSASMKNPEKP